MIKQAWIFSNAESNMRLKLTKRRRQRLRVTHARLCAASRMHRDVLSRHAAQHTLPPHDHHCPHAPATHTPPRIPPCDAPLHTTSPQKTCAPNKTHRTGQPRARTVVHAAGTSIQCAHRRVGGTPKQPTNATGTHAAPTHAATPPYHEKQKRQFCMAHATHAVLGRQLACPEEALRYVEGLSAVHALAYGETASLDHFFSRGQGNFTVMAYNKALEYQKAGFHLHMHGALDKWESWEIALASLPQDTQGVQIHYEKIDELGMRYGHAVAVVQHKGEWWWVDSDDPPRIWQGTEDWERLKNTDRRSRDAQLVVHKQGRTPDNASGFDWNEAERLWLGGAPDATKIAEWAQHAKTAKLTIQAQQKRAKRKKSLAANKRNTEATRNADHNPTPTPARSQPAPAQHPPSPRSDAAPGQRTPQPPCERDPAEVNHTVTNPQGTQTHSGTQKRAAAQTGATSTLLAKRQATNTAMNHIQTHITTFFTKRGTATQEEPPPPNPTPPRDQSTHAKEDPTQHTAPATPPPDLPRNTLTVLTYNVRGLNAHSRDVSALIERHQPDVMVLTETHLRTGEKKKGWFRGTLRGYTTWAACHTTEAQRKAHGHTHTYR